MNNTHLSKIFAPQSDDIPSQPLPSMPAIAGRARVMLRSFTSDQVEAAAIRIKQEIDEENCNEVDALKAAIEKRDYRNHTLLTLPRLKEYPEGHDFQLFAVLSLRLLSDAIHFLNKTPMNVPAAGECALKAMDAVCFAEHLYEAAWLVSYTQNISDKELTKALLKEKSEQQEWLKADIERRRKEKSDHSASMNKIRHESLYDVQKRVIEEWNKDRNRFRSGAKAGLHFADWLEAQNIFRKFNKSDNSYEWYTPRTVTEWICDYARKIGFRIK